MGGDSGYSHKIDNEQWWPFIIWLPPGCFRMWVAVLICGQSFSLVGACLCM